VAAERAEWLFIMRTAVAIVIAGILIAAAILTAFH
jgi:hypothetical protein